MTIESLDIGEETNLKIGESIYLVRKTESFEEEEDAYRLAYAGMPNESRCSFVVQQTPDHDEKTPYNLYYPSAGIIRLGDLKLAVIAREDELEIKNLDPLE